MPICYRELVGRRLMQASMSKQEMPAILSAPWPNGNRTSKQHYRMAKGNAKLVQFKQSNIRFASVTVCLQMFMQIQCRRSKVICWCVHLISLCTLTLKMSPLGPSRGQHECRSQLGSFKLFDSIACFRVVMVPLGRGNCHIQDKSTGAI